MSVIVKRGAGDIPGPDIINEILSTEQLQREAGRQKVNETDSDRVDVSGNTIGTSFKQPGKIVKATDKTGSRNGYLEAFSFRVQIDPDYSITSALQIEQVADQ